MNWDSLLPLKAGESAVLAHLKAAHLNGILVHVLFFDTISERFVVELCDTGKKIKVKVNNLNRALIKTGPYSEYDRLYNIANDANDFDSLEEVREGLLTLSDVHEERMAMLVSLWSKAMLRINSEVARKQVVSTMALLMDTFNDPFCKMLLTKMSARAEADIGNDVRCMELLEPLIEHHYGHLPNLARILFECYYRQGLFDKIWTLFKKADDLIERNLYACECNIVSFYLAFIKCISGLDRDFLPIKPSSEHMKLIESCIHKAEVAADPNGEFCLFNFTKAELEYYRGNYGVAIHLLGEFNEAIQIKFGIEDAGVGDAMFLMFQCYVEKNDYANAKYCLKKYKKHAKPEPQFEEALKRRLQSVKGSTKKKTKAKKIRAKARCGNAFCFRVENQEEKFMFCSKCRICKYCSRECQRIHWKHGHKESCKN